jgi:hypothetical protein
MESLKALNTTQTIILALVDAKMGEGGVTAIDNPTIKMNRRMYQPTDVPNQWMNQPTSIDHQTSNIIIRTTGMRLFVESIASSPNLTKTAGPISRSTRP